MNSPMERTMNEQYELTTTLALLRKHGACESGYRTLLKSLGGCKTWPKNKPINLLTILDSNGVADMMWAMRATESDCIKARYLICADIAESVLHIFTAKYPNDDRPAKAIQAARDAANGVISEGDLSKARNAAYAAAAAYDAAAAAYDAAADAAAAAYAAAAAAYDAAAYAAAAAAAARTKERHKQATIIRKWLKA